METRELVNRLRLGVSIGALLVLTVSTLLGHSATFANIISEEFYLRTSEGVSINARTYKHSSSTGRLPAIICCHGLVASHQTMQSTFSVEFAKRGFYVVAIDFRGHGNSGGSLPHFNKSALSLSEISRSILDIIKVWPVELYADIEAAIDYLNSRDDVDTEKIALLGHSMGGGAVIYAGSVDERVKAVVAIAPAVSPVSSFMNESTPRNLLIATGETDPLITPGLSLQILAKTLGKPLSRTHANTQDLEVGKLYGSFSNGTARRLILSPGVDHTGEMLDTFIAEEAIRWVETAFNVGSPPPIHINTEKNLYTYVSTISVILLPYLAMRYVYMWLQEKLKSPKIDSESNTSETTESSLRSPRSLTTLYQLYFALLIIGGLLLIPYVIFLRGTPQVLPVMFADLLVLYHLAISLPLLLCILVFKDATRELLPELKALTRRNSLKSLILGAVVATVLFTTLNLTFSWSLIDLFPTMRELLILSLLTVILLPMILVDEIWIRGLYQKKPSLRRPLRIAVAVVVYVLPKAVLVAGSAFLIGSFAGLLGLLLFALSLLNAWIFEETQNVLGCALLTSFIFAWVGAVLMPFL